MAEIEVETTFNDTGLQVFFVLKDGLKGINDVSNDMNVAYTNIRDYFKEDENLKWITESECSKLNDLTKKDVFVLQEFKGNAFDYLKNTKSLIIGPRCLINCLFETLPIPSNKSPVYTTAMRNLHICVSGLGVTEKLEIKNYVLWMGGHYYGHLLECCTHLISNTVQSSKYEQAALSNKLIMHPDWIKAVWKRSQNENILGTNSEFEKYKLPIFYNLNITSTGLTNDKRNEIKNLIVENGGKYDGKFQSKEIDIVILEKNSTDSKKYKAAIQFKKECLLPSWIIDSVAKGYALPVKNYRVHTIKISTPTKDSSCISVRDFNPDNSELSGISQFVHSGLRQTCLIDETCSSTISSNKSDSGNDGNNDDVGNNILRRSSRRNQNKQQHKPYHDIMKQLDLFSSRDIKKAGTFLDGCRIYLTGFSFDEKEKINKILNSGGAIRYEEINDNITHVIVGEVTSNQLELHSKLLNQSQLMGIVTLNWLLESLKSRFPANENEYLYKAAKNPLVSEPEAPSPSSKKTIQSMNHSFKKPTLPKRKLYMETIDKDKENQNDVDNNNDEDDLLQQYNPKNLSPVVPLKYPKSNPINEPQPGPSGINTKSKTVKQITGTTIIPSANLKPSCTSLTTQDDYGGISGATSDMYTEDDYEDATQYDFFEGLAIYIHEPDNEDLHKQLTIYSENAGGKVVSHLYKQIVDYIIVSSERAIDIKEIPVKGKQIVNTLWLEDAMYKNELIEKDYYHEPIPLTANEKPLEGLTIVISIYTANERNFLQSLISVLGGRASETYIKKERPLLVCPSPEGAKYDAAIRWNNPVVTAEWLLECAKTGKKINLQSYLVGNSTLSDHWQESQFLKHHKNNEEKSSSSSSSSHQSQQSKEKDKEMEIAIEKNLNNDFDDDNVFLEPQQQISQRINNNDNSNDNDKKNLEHTDNKKLNNDNYGTPDHLIAKHRRLSELIGNKTPKTPVVSPITGNNNLNLTFILQDLPTPTRECVYEVCKEIENTNKTPTLSQNVRKFITPAKNANVSPKIPEIDSTPEMEKKRLDSIYGCYHMNIKRKPVTPLSEVKRRFWKEALGEHFWEPEQKSQHFTAPSQSSSSSKEQEVQQKQQQQIQDINTQNLATVTSSSSEHIRQLKDFIKRRDSDAANLNLRKQKIPDTEDDGGNTDDNHPHHDQNAAVLHKFDSELGGTEQLIGWNDPSEFLPARRSRRMHYHGTPRFSISCSTEQIKQEIIEKIKSLNGEICENLINYDETCTHIVCEKLNRGEKILSCIAAGKWILTLKYIIDSHDEGEFLDEECYEWGNPKAISNLPKFENEKVEQIIANAAFRWRTKLSNLKQNLSHPNSDSNQNQIIGAFKDFCCIILGNKKESIENLVKAGGGIVLKNIQPPFTRKLISNEIFKNLTHCFLESKTNLSKSDYEILNNANIKILSILYLNAYLTSENRPDINKFSFSF